MGSQSQVVLSRCAGSVLHVHDVRCAGVVCEGCDHGESGGEEMEAHSRKWKAAEEKVYAMQDVVQLIWFQADYMKEFEARTDYPLQTDDVEKTKQHGVDWKLHKDENIIGFRDQVFRSVVTDTLGCKFHTPWFTALDDSLESYVK